MPRLCALLLVGVCVALAGCGSAPPDLAAVRANMAAEQLAVGPPVAAPHGIVLVPIPPGTFTMGGSDDEAKVAGFGAATERPPHAVTITRPFYLSACEIS